MGHPNRVRVIYVVPLCVSSTRTSMYGMIAACVTEHVCMCTHCGMCVYMLVCGGPRRYTVQNLKALGYSILSIAKVSCSDCVYIMGLGSSQLLYFVIYRHSIVMHPHAQLSGQCIVTLVPSLIGPH